MKENQINPRLHEELKIHKEHIDKLIRLDEADLWLRKDDRPFPKYVRIKIPNTAGWYNFIKHELYKVFP